MKLSINKNILAEKSAGSANIRAQAEQRRLQYISPGAGKANAYQQKGAEADAYRADRDAGREPNMTMYPHIVREAVAFGVTHDEMAKRIVDARRMWATASSIIEALEHTHLSRVDAATSPAEITAATNIDWSDVDRALVNLDPVY